MKLLLLSLLLFTGVFSEVSAQKKLVSDFNTVMQIPDILTMQASATHMYVLSESDGLIVFRANTDTLQYLFTSDGMATRGSIMQSDVRFAYLFGAGNRLTVLEPTSLLGVFSSTNLSDRPRSVARVGTRLYVALGENGLSHLSLESPSAFDQAATPVGLPEEFGGAYDLVRLGNQVAVLGDDNQMAIFVVDGNDIHLNQTIRLQRSVSRLHAVNGTLYASDRNGGIHTVHSDGSLSRLTAVGAPVDKVMYWNGYKLIRAANGRLSAYHGEDGLIVLRSDTQAGNHFAIAQDNLWVSNYAEVAKSTIEAAAGSDQTRASSGGTFRIRPIENIVIPFPRPVLISLGVEGAEARDVRFQYRSEVENAEIRGQGFHWQPQSNQIGLSRFTVTATNAAGVTDSTSFTVEVRSFNAPPRFNPVRPLAIVVGENFQLPVRAVDPDGIDRDLIRYHGVDLPEGATISERTGMFMWNPDRRQVGTHQFQVIATDQFGAASQLPLTITVRHMTEDDDDDEFNPLD